MTGIRVLSWNVHGGPSDAKVEWLLAQPWDVAVLLEVSQTGWRRLRGVADLSVASVFEYRPHSTRRGRRMGVAVAVRPPHTLSPAYPPAGFGDAEPFADQCTAVDAILDGHPVTVVGFHAPNAAVRGQAAKERTYRSLHEWLAAQRGDRQFIVGVDSNVWGSGLDGPHSPTNPALIEQTGFLADGARHGLVDTFRVAAKDRTVAWTYERRRKGHEPYRDRMDRILVSPSLRPVDAGVLLDARGTLKGHRMSDHAAVWAALEPGR
jgi:exonuclease III